MRIVYFTSLAVILVTASSAQARWSDELTSRMWRSSDVDANGFADCPANSANSDVASLGRPEGGWFEWRFADSPTHPQGFFQVLFPTVSSSPADLTRACPRTFNEYTMNHHHGVSSARVASDGKYVYAVYDSIGGYYGANTIKLQQDPSVNTSLPAGGVFPVGPATGSLANNQRGYTVAEIVRNGRGYIRIDPASVKYGGRFDLNNNFQYDEAEDGCHNMGTSAGTYDPEWQSHSRWDHERTFCAPPATIQTFDPDIDIRPDIGGNGGTLVAWTERYVEGKYGVSGPTNRGFDPLFPVPASAPWFPNRKLVVHVEQFSTSALASNYDNRTGGIQHTPRTSDAGLYVATSETNNAFSPRVTQILSGGVNKAFVVWAEAEFEYKTKELTAGESFKLAPDYGPVSTWAGITLQAKLSDAGTGIGWSAVNVPSPGISCGAYPVNSGRASGRKQVWTGTHDVATMKDGSGVERPVVVMNEYDSKPAPHCNLTVKRWTGSVWERLGLQVDLRVNTNVSPMAPRITVHNNVPYVVWVEGETNSVVQVKRLVGNNWQSLGTRWNTAFADSANTRARGPSIAVTDIHEGGGSGDNGAYVYVSVSESDQSFVANVRVRRCRTAKSGSTFSCQTEPELFVDKAHTFAASDLEVYKQTDHLGTSWGQAVITANGPSGQLTGWDKDWSPVANMRFKIESGATDLVATQTSDGEYLNMYLSYPGPVQDHRVFDHGLYVRAERQLAAEQWLLAAGDDHTLALQRNPGAATGRTVYSWGDNATGELGISTATTNSQSPRALAIGTATTSIVKLDAHNGISGALASDGKLYLWGNNAYGQICNGNKVSPQPSPAARSGTHFFVDFAVGPSFVAAVRDDGSVWTCGTNTWGVLGDGTAVAESLTWVQVKVSAATPLTDAVAVDAGASSICALVSSGAAYCWGSNGSDQLGRGAGAPAQSNLAAPVLLPTQFGPAKFKQIALGKYFALALNADGRVFSWGSNASGQLGVGDVMNRNQATLASNTANIRSIYAAAKTSFFRTFDDSIYSAGDDALGTAGVGSSNSNQWSFQLLAQKFQSIATGSAAEHVYGFFMPSTLESTVQWSSWGRGTDGQTGWGVLANSPLPRRAFPGALTGCASSTAAFNFFGGADNQQMIGCAATRSFATKGNSCASGYSTCSPDRWSDYRHLSASVVPTHNFWTSAPLNKFNNGSSGNCSAVSQGGIACPADAPMRVCAPSATDPLGNTCPLYNCGYAGSLVDKSFGGCAGNTAGTLCCKD